MDATQIGVVIGAVSGAIGAIGGGVCTWGIGAYLKLRADRREDIKLHDAREDAEDEKEDNTLRFIIGRQDGELSALRAEMKEMQVNHRAELTALHNQHNECETKHAKLETELRMLKESLQREVNSKVEMLQAETKAAIRQGVHDVKDALHAKDLKEQADKAR